MVLDLIKKILTAKRFYANYLRELYSEFRVGLQTGMVTKVTADHADPAIAALGKVFDNLVKHPLVANFMRHEPELYVVHPYFRTKNIEPVVGARLLGRKVMIDRKTFEHLSLEQLESVIAHELGHHVRLDEHFRNAYRRIIRFSTPEMEKDADRIAALLTGDSIYQDTALKALASVHYEVEAGNKLLEDYEKASFLERIKIQRQLAAQATYLKPSDRSEFLQELGEQMKDPKKRTHLEQELRRRLGAEHSRVFGHHHGL
jgi:Zn-dependent protease with chaperone function